MAKTHHREKHIIAQAKSIEIALRESERKMKNLCIHKQHRASMKAIAKAAAAPTPTQSCGQKWGLV
jgi:hypothetical protein